MKKAGLVEISFTLSKQERKYMIRECWKIVDDNEDIKECADALTATILDLREQRQF
jgi:uncharacterized tellurite resistance protein B-like protein